MRILLLIAVLGVAAADDVATTKETSVAALANTKFAVELLQKVSNGNENVFFSPYSISAALGMTSLGAAGETRKQVESAFHFNDVNTKEDPLAIHKVYKSLVETYNKPNNNYSLNTANRLFGQNNFEIKPEFQDNCKKYYHAELEQLDFSTGTAEGIINKWVEQQTNDKIKDLFKPNSLDASTVLVLVNAIYFKGNWQSKFKVDSTKDEEFRVANGSPKKVPMMRQKQKFGYYYDDKSAVKVLEMPYVGNDLSMVVILPDADNGLPAFINSLTGEKLENLIKSVSRREVDVKIPKFKLETEYSLKETLIKLGVTDLFSDRANLLGISNRSLAVSEAKHKAYIVTDEEGTEAAAATGLVFNKSFMALPKSAVEFYVDHSFYLAIVDRRLSDFILFHGAVNSII